MVVAALSACIEVGGGEGTRQATRLYLLAPIASTPPASAPLVGDHLTIGVGPLAFPAYLDRSSVLVRVGPRELRTLPFAHWAEPLEENVGRVLVDNLALLTGSPAVYRYPWPQQETPQVQLQLTVDRFDAAPGGQAVLVVRWAWCDASGALLMPRAYSVLQQAVTGAGADGVVAAMSTVLDAFSREAAARLANIRPAA
jgi:hypothetical protein